MQLIVIIGSGVVTTYFGPFKSKKEVEDWARETENRQYAMVVLYPPYAFTVEKT